MIRYLKNEEIDRKIWDHHLDLCFNRLIYAYSWYLDEVCDDWDALVYRDYEAMMPIPKRSAGPFFLSRQPLFCQQLGIFSKTFPTQDLPETFLNAIPTSFRIIRLHMNSLNRLPNLPLRLNLVLNLIPGPELLEKAFSTHAKRNIRKSKENGCSLLEGIATRDMLALFRWQMESKKSGFTEAQYLRLERLINAAISKGLADTVGVYSPVNHLCSAAVFLRDGRRLYYLMGASDDMGHEYLASYRILEYIIRKYAGQDILLDFEGSENQGIARFFKGFGAQAAPYPLYEKFRLGPLNSLARKWL